MINVPYIHTKDGITVYFRGESLTVPVSDPDYKRLTVVLRNPDSTEWELSETMKPIRDRVQNAVQKHESDGFTIQGGRVSFKGALLNGYMSAKLEQMVDRNWDLKPIAAFLDNLALNPCPRTREDLYSFLEYGKMPITPDGYFLAYKRIREDYTDCATGKFDNSVGKHVAMPRSAVDANPDRTCSSGLHVCSFEYLTCFGGARTIVCKINPRDVVAIPRDYNNTKMRVSEYVVIDDITQLVNQRRNVLAERPAWHDNIDFESDCDEDCDEQYNDEDEEDETFVIDGVDLDGEESELGFADTSGEAKAAAYRMFQQYKSITVRSAVDGRVVLQLSAIQE